MLPLLRVVIMALASAAPLTVAQEFVDGTVKKLVGYIKDEEGLTTDEAKAIVGNFLFDLGLNATIIGGILKTKLAIKTAEFLGFPAKSVAKKALSAKAAKAAAKYAGPFEKFKAMSLINKLIIGGGAFGGLTWIFVGLANVIEPGIYKPKEANDVWQRFTGIRPFPEKAAALSPGNLDAQRFNDLARSLEAAGIRGFNDPVKMQSRVYSREDLADIIDYVYGREVLAGRTPKDYRDILPLIQPYFIGGTTTPSPSSTSAKTSPEPASSPSVKVFTGIVSQGVVGSGLSFTPRQDDLIESISELEQAVTNNEAPFLAALPGKVIREVKVVSSVIVGGIQKRGTTQRIVSGSYANGTPKYKSVTNKFAVGDYYILNANGSRTKITRIVYGPTNATSFQPSESELDNLATAVAQNIVTSNTDDISQIVTNTPTAVTPPAEAAAVLAPVLPPTRKFPAPPGAVPKEFFETRDPANRFVRAEKSDLQDWLAGGNDVYDIYRMLLGWIGTDSEKTVNSHYINWAKNITPYEADQMRVFYKGGVATVSPPAPAPTQEIAAPVEAPANPSLPREAQFAATLYEFYGALGQQLPNLDERSRLYERLGLGQAAFYTGTAEQNTRLLKALKASGV